MKKLVAFCLFLLLCLPALAVEDGQVVYLGGTVPGVNVGVVGRLDTTAETALIFEYSGNKVEIPYAAIQSFEYSKDVAHHLGVLPAIAVGMFKMRRHGHFFRISYHDSNNVAQAVVFEVSKRMPRTLLAVLTTRAPQASQPEPPHAGRKAQAPRVPPSPTVTPEKLSQNGPPAYQAEGMVRS